MEIRDDIPKAVIEATIEKRMKQNKVERALVYWRGTSFWVKKK